MVRVEVIRNLFDRCVVGEWSLERATVGALRGAVGIDDAHCVSFVDGCRADDDVAPNDGATVTLVLVPANNFALQIVVTVAIAAISIGAQAALAGPGPQRPKPQRTPEALQPSRSPNGIYNTSGGGYVVPYVYGRHRVGGHVIQRFARPRFNIQNTPGLEEVHIHRTDDATSGKVLYQRIIVARAPVESISDIVIDRNGIGEISGIRYDTVSSYTWDSAPRAPHGYDYQTVDKDFSSTTLAEGFPGAATTIETDIEVDEFELVLRFRDGAFTRDAFDLVSGIFQQIKVEYRVKGDTGSWSEITDPRTGSGPLPIITERQVSPIDYRILSPPLPGRNIYEVRVSHVWHQYDSLATEFYTDLDVYKLIQITQDDRAHPGLASVAVEHLITDQTGSIDPTRVTSLVEGFNDLRIYSDTSTYTEAWSNNPAWVTMHYLTMPEDGLGEFYNHDDDFDIQSFIDWASYCDATVSDGRDGTESRCTYDLPHDVAESPQEILNRLALCGNAWIVRENGTWRAVIDQAADMSMVFSEANTLPGTAVYSPIPKFQRASRVQIQFTNSELEYVRDSIGAEDDTVVDASSDHQTTSITGWGHTRPSHALRTAWRQVLHNRYSDAKVELQATIEGFTLRVGDVFGYASKSAGIGIAAGKVQRVTQNGTRLWLDDEIELESGTIYEVVLQHAADDSIEYHTITTSAAVGIDWIDTADSWSLAPVPGDNYTVGEVSYAVEKFRCEYIGKSKEQTVKVRGVKYDPLVYAYADTVSLSEDIPDGGLADVDREFPGVVQDLTAVESKNTVVIGWAPPEDGTPVRFDVYWRTDHTDDGPWVFAGSSLTRSFDISGLDSGTTYGIAVVAVGARGGKVTLDDASMTTITTS